MQFLAIQRTHKLLDGFNADTYDDIQLHCP
jgi:hypothetical protein